jgi:hypothetical protein
MDREKIRIQIYLANAGVLSLFFTVLVGLSFSAPAQTATAVKELVKSLSNNKLRVETTATPYKLVGDFNGDKVEDVAVIVSLADTVENIRRAIKIENPYAGAWGDEINTELLALFIIHGKGKGWQFAQESSVLLLGQNSALIFQKGRLGESGDGMKIEKDRRGRVRIVFPTEASEGILKWNGKTYAWNETQP